MGRWKRFGPVLGLLTLVSVGVGIAQWFAGSLVGAVTLSGLGLLAAAVVVLLASLDRFRQGVIVGLLATGTLIVADVFWRTYDPFSAGIVIASGVSAVLLVLAGQSFQSRWQTIRCRLFLGVPWGTLTTMAFVIGFYLIAQHGLNHWRQPVTLPYTAWSWFYLEGSLTAGIAHSGASHLIGNMVATLVFGTLAEYAWGHYPRARGDHVFGSPLHNPFIRAFLVVPAVLVSMAVVTAVFTWGPVIGFSGVVFALAGFAVVRYPLLTVLAVFVERWINLLYRAIPDPVVTASASPSFSTPWWANIAIQGHLLGLLAGIFIATVVFRRRDELPTPQRLLTGLLFLSVNLSLWALWWYRGNGTFVLYRGLGLSILVIGGTVLTLAILASTRTIAIPEQWHWLRSGPSLPSPSIDVLEWKSDQPLTWAHIGLAILAIPLLFQFVIAAPVNLVIIEDGTTQPADAISVRGYDVYYAEDTPNQMIGVVDVVLFNESTQVNSSGVIVVNQQKQLWNEQFSKRELAFGGTRRVIVGGPTWRETVVAKREGWNAVGGNTTYRIRMGVRGQDKKTVYRSSPALVEAIIAGRNVTIEPAEEHFYLTVATDSTTDRAPIPASNQSVRLNGLRINRTPRDRLIATHGNTSVTIASAESYR